MIYFEEVTYLSSLLCINSVSLFTPCDLTISFYTRPYNIDGKKRSCESKTSLRLLANNCCLSNAALIRRNENLEVRLRWKIIKVFQFRFQAVLFLLQNITKYVGGEAGGVGSFNLSVGRRHSLCAKGSSFKVYLR